MIRPGSLWRRDGDRRCLSQVLGGDVRRHGACVLHPPLCLRIADEIEQPPEHCDTIVATEA
jgi:hypothetical protein